MQIDLCDCTPVAERTQVNGPNAGASATQKLGTLALSSRGRATLRFDKGFNWRDK